MSDPMHWVLDNTLGRVPPKVRRYMNSWRFWTTALVMATMLIGSATIAIGVVTLHNEQRTLKERAIRIGNIQSQYINCVSNVDPANNVRFLVRGLDELTNAIVDNNKNVFKKTRPSDFFYRTRQENLARLQKAQRHILKFDPDSIPIANVAACKVARNHDLVVNGVQPSELPPPHIPGSIKHNQNRKGGGTG